MASNDFVISTNLIVFGMSTFTGGQTFDGQMIVDLDNTEALLVRKDSDGGDVFIVDTVNSVVIVAGTLRGTNAAAFALIDQAASDTVPTLIPRRDELDTGLGGVTDGAISIINEGVESARFDGSQRMTMFDNGITLERPVLVAPGTLDSHDFLWTGHSFDSGSHDVDWQAFVTPITNAGDSLFRWATRIDGAGFVDVIRYDNEGRFCVCQPHQVSIGSFGFVDNAHVNITGAFVDDYGGGPDSTYKVLIDGSSTGDSTRTNRQVMFGIFVSSGGIITQNNSETVNNVGAMYVNAVPITPGTDTINETFTAKFQNAATAGTENYVVIIDQSSPGPPDAQLRIGKSQSLGIKLMVAGLGLNNLDQNAQTRLTGLFQPVGAVDDFASILHIDARLQGVSGDTNHLTGAHFAADVRTQGVTENIANISQVQIDEPDITDVLIGDITNAQSLLISGSPTEGESNFSIRSLGTALVQFAGSMIAQGASGHAFGSPATNSVLTIDTTSTADGGGTNAAAVNFFPDYTGASGITEFIALMNLGGNIQTQAVAEAITNVSTLRVGEPSISIGAGSSVTNAQSLLITGSPTEGTNNFAIRSLGTEATLLAGLQLSIGQSTLDDFAQFIIRGNFSSGGGSFICAKVDVTGGLIGASGDVDIATAFFRNNITTQAVAEVITDVSQVVINDPVITIGAGSSVTNAQSLKINGSPTEGTNNFAIRSTGAAPSLFIGTQFVIGQSAVDVNWQFLLAGSFTTGAAGETAKLRIEGALIGASGTTTGIFGSYFDAAITTQAVAEVITDVAQVRIDEPQITIGAGSSVTNAQSLLIVAAPTEGTNNYALRVAAGDVILGGNLAVSGAGPHSIAGTPSGIIGLIISETFTSDGSSTLASGVFITQTLVGASGDTTSLTGTTFISAITTQTETETIANISQVEMNEPFITDNLTGDITNAQTLLIVNAPTEGVNNYALRVAAGATLLGGELETTAGRIKTVTRQTTTYTILVTDSVVFGNTDSAGFTATLPAGVSGQTLKIVNSGSSGNSLTVAPDGSDDLLGVNSSFTLFDGESLDITFDSTDGWY